MARACRRSKHFGGKSSPSDGLGSVHSECAFSPLSSSLRLSYLSSLDDLSGSWKSSPSYPRCVWSTVFDAFLTSSSSFLMNYYPFAMVLFAWCATFPPPLLILRTMTFLAFFYFFEVFGGRLTDALKPLWEFKMALASFWIFGTDCFDFVLSSSRMIISRW